jgi:lipooligosaccharide transport system ATP-binding protein
VPARPVTAPPAAPVDPAAPVAPVAATGAVMPAVAPPAVALRGVTKRFGDLVAVDALDLEVPHGVCLGFLGPNGAGKSTTMRLLTGQATADAGEISVLGHPVPSQGRQARARMGVVPQLDNLDEELTARENLEVFARLYRLPRAGRRAAVDRALELARLTDRAGTFVEQLSGGMRRRLLIARGLVHSPELVLLDEPTVGLDPQVRQELWTYVDRLRSEGVTTVMSTHYIEEAERLADTIAVMHHGRLIARGTPAELVAEHVGAEVLEVWGSAPELETVARRAEELGLATRPAGTSIAVLGVEGLAEDLGPGRRRPATLEDVFVVLTGEVL